MKITIGRPSPSDGSSLTFTDQVNDVTQKCAAHLNHDLLPGSPASVYPRFDQFLTLILAQLTRLASGSVDYKILHARLE